MLAPRLVAAAVTVAPADGWSWLTENVNLGSLVQALGLGTLVVLFATDRILTRGQHTRRVADLVKYWSGRYDEAIKSRDYYRDARLEEKARAEKSEAELVAMARETSALSSRILGSLDEAARDVKGGR